MYINEAILSFVLVSVMAPIAIAFRAPENPVAVKPPVLVRTPTKVVVPDLLNHGEDASLSTTISNEKLMEVGKTIASQKFVKARHATERKQWGIDNEDCPSVEYWSDSRIHTFGNTGFLGALHAAMAPLSTKVIDMVAYDGQDVRSLVSCPTLSKLDSVSFQGSTSHYLLHRFSGGPQTFGNCSMQQGQGPRSMLWGGHQHSSVA
jgi:hypothetical protein